MSMMSLGSLALRLQQLQHLQHLLQHPLLQNPLQHQWRILLCWSRCSLLHKFCLTTLPLEQLMDLKRLSGPRPLVSNGFGWISLGATTLTMSTILCQKRLLHDFSLYNVSRIFFCKKVCSAGTGLPNRFHVSLHSCYKYREQTWMQTCGHFCVQCIIDYTQLYSSLSTIYTTFFFTSENSHVRSWCHGAVRDRTALTWRPVSMQWIGMLLYQTSWPTRAASALMSPGPKHSGCGCIARLPRKAAAFKNWRLRLGRAVGNSRQMIRRLILIDVDIIDI